MEPFPEAMSGTTASNIGDANSGPLRTLGTNKMPVRFERLVTVLEFIVCEKRALPFTLGAEYCDRFVEAIYPRRKKVEFVDFSEDPIIRRFSPIKGRGTSSRERTRRTRRGNEYPRR